LKYFGGAFLLYHIPFYLVRQRKAVVETVNNRSSRHSRSIRTAKSFLKEYTYSKGIRKSLVKEDRFQNYPEKSMIPSSVLPRS
jgi:hypothetical protein